MSTTVPTKSQLLHAVLSWLCCIGSSIASEHTGTRSNVLAVANRHTDSLVITTTSAKATDLAPSYSAFNQPTILRYVMTTLIPSSIMSPPATAKSHSTLALAGANSNLARERTRVLARKKNSKRSEVVSVVLAYYSPLSYLSGLRPVRDTGSGGTGMGSLVESG